MIIQIEKVIKKEPDLSESLKKWEKRIDQNCYEIITKQ